MLLLRRYCIKTGETELWFNEKTLWFVGERDERLVVGEGRAEHEDFDPVPTGATRRRRDRKAESVVRIRGGPGLNQIGTGLVSPQCGVELTIDEELDFEGLKGTFRIEGPPADPFRSGQVDRPTEERVEVGPGRVAGHRRQQQHLEGQFARDRQKQSR